MAKDLAASSEPFNYAYTDDELSELSESIRKVATRVHALHVALDINSTSPCAPSGQLLPTLGLARFIHAAD